MFAKKLSGENRSSQTIKCFSAVDCKLSQAGKVFQHSYLFNVSNLIIIIIIIIGKTVNSSSSYKKEKDSRYCKKQKQETPE